MQMMSAPFTASRAVGAGSTSMRCRIRARSAKARARSGLRPKTRARRMGRATRIASKCVRAWTPVPMTARSAASSRASRRVATPETAAVRIAVMELASMTASSRPRSHSKSSTAPWWESSSVPWLPGKAVMALTPTAWGEARYAGMTA